MSKDRVQGGLADLFFTVSGIDARYERYVSRFDEGNRKQTEQYEKEAASRRRHADQELERAQRRMEQESERARRESERVRRESEKRMERYGLRPSQPVRRTDQQWKAHVDNKFDTAATRFKIKQEAQEAYRRAVTQETPGSKTTRLGQPQTPGTHKMRPSRPSKI